MKSTRAALSAIAAGAVAFLSFGLIDSAGRMNVDVGGATLNVDLGSVSIEDGTTHTQKAAVDSSGNISTKPSQRPQTSLLAQIANAVTGTGGQTGQSVDGYNGLQMLEVIAVGTVAAQACTFAVEGSFDGSNWYNVGIQQLASAAAPGNGVSVPQRANSATITPGNGNTRQVFQILDAYKYVRVNLTANTLGTGFYANLYAEPV